MKHENFPKPAYKEPDSHGGAFDTVQMRQLREQLAQDQLVETEPDKIEQQPEPKTEYEAINAAWDDVAKSVQTDKPVEHYSPEEALALVEELDKLHADTVVEASAEVSESNVEPVPEAPQVAFEEMTVRETVGNTLADIEIAFGNHSHDIVQTARVMAEQVMDHLGTIKDAESQVEWEQALQMKIDNLRQLRSDFVGPDGQKMNAQDPMDAVMPNAYQLQPELASKRRAAILAESGVATTTSDPEQKSESGSFRIEDIDSLESDFSDASFSADVPEVSNDAVDDSVYNERHAAVAAARGSALMKDYKPSGVPLGYDPKAPRTTVKKPAPKKKGFLARLFGA